MPDIQLLKEAAESGNIGDFLRKNPQFFLTPSLFIDKLDLRGQDLTDVEIAGPVSNLDTPEILKLSEINSDFSDFSNSRLKDFFLSRSSFKKAKFMKSRIENIRFHLCDFGGAILTDAQMNNIDGFCISFSFANLEGVKMNKCFIPKIDLSFANITRLDANRLKSPLANFTGVKAETSLFISCNLACIQMTGSQFKGAFFTDNEELDMFEPTSLIACFAHGASLQNAHFINTLLIHSDFSGADLTNAEFKGRRERKFGITPSLDLTGAIFTGANLTDTVFEGCDLSTACFDRAILSNTLFKDCNVAGASFFEANIKSIQGNQGDWIKRHWQEYF